MNKKYLSNGNGVSLIEKLNDGRYLVSNIFVEYDSYGNSEEYSEDTNLYIVDKVYDHPPAILQDEKLKSLTESIRLLSEKKYEIEKDILGLQRREEITLERIKKIEKLQYVFDFIDGKISHYVEYDQRGLVNITKFEDAKSEYGSNPEKKLLVLFGDSKRDMQWRLNQYSDGSGYYISVIPCTSYIMALQEAQKLVDKEIGNDGVCRLSLIEICKKHNLKLPKEYIENYNQLLKENRDREIEKMEESLQKLKNSKIEYQ